MKTIKIAIVGLLLTFFSSNIIAQSDFSGKWLVADQKTIVELKHYDGVYSGHIISSEHPQARIGMMMIKVLKQTDDTWNGKLYAPKRQEWYDAEFKLKGDALQISISVGFYNKTVVWKKVNHKV